MQGCLLAHLVSVSNAIGYRRDDRECCFRCVWRFLYGSMCGVSGGRLSWWPGRVTLSNQNDSFAADHHIAAIGDGGRLVRRDFRDRVALLPGVCVQVVRGADVRVDKIELQMIDGFNFVSMDEQVLHEKLLVDEGLRVQQSILRPFLVAFVQHAAQPDHSRLAHPLHRVEVELVEEQIDEYFFPEHIPVVVDGQPETSDPKLYEVL